MNIENDFIRDENFESIASHTYVNLAVKTRILSTKKLMFVVQTKAFHFRFDSESLEICQAHRDSIVYLVTNRRRSKKWERKKEIVRANKLPSLILAY